MGAIIDLQFYLDLPDAACLNLLYDPFISLSYAASEMRETLPVNNYVQGVNDLLLRNLDNAVIENLHKNCAFMNLQSYDSVHNDRGHLRQA